MSTTLLLILFVIQTTFSSLIPSLSIRSTICPVLLQQDRPFAPKPTPTSKDGRIINGDLVSENIQPALIFLEIPTLSQGYFMCTGSLLSAYWVITAAHCGVNGNTRVRIGAKRAGGDSLGPFIQVAHFVNHPGYNDSDGRKYDIAVIRLASPAISIVRFMKINVNDDLPHANAAVRAVGYGVSLYAGEQEEASGFLRQVDMPVSSNHICQRAYNAIDSEKQICAGYKRGGCDACQGDSGGPLIQYDKSGNLVLVGITSFGYECALADYPGVYVRTSAFKTWLDSQGVVYEKASDADQVIVETYEENDGRLSAVAIIGIIVGGLLLISVATTLIVILCLRLSFLGT